MRFPRMCIKDQMLSFGAFGAGMLLLAVWMISNTSFKNTPPAAMLICVIFLLCWFGVIGWFASFAIKALETVEIDTFEIRLRLGPLVLRRIPTERIKTVGLVGFQMGKTQVIDPICLQRLLVLSYKTPEQMKRNGEKQLRGSDGLFIFRVMDFLGQYRRDEDLSSRAYLQANYMYQPVWIELSKEAEQELRRCIPGAKFLHWD